MLTLSKALKTGKLAQFVEQEEARGIGPASRRKLEKAIKALATQPPEEGRTSRSSSGDDSSEK